MTSRYLLRTYQGLFLFIFRLLDIIMLVACATGMHLYAGYGWPSSIAAKAVILVAILTFAIFADKANLYRPWRGKRLRYEIGLLAAISALTIACVAALSKIFGFIEVSNASGAWFLWWLAALIVSLSAIRLVLRPLLKLLRRRGANIRRVLLVGIGPEANDFVVSLRRHPEFGFSFVGYSDDRLSQRNNFAPVLEYLGPTTQLEEICKEKEVDQVWYGYPVEATHRVLTAIDVLKNCPVGMRQVMNHRASPHFFNSITGILGTPMLDIDVNITDGYLGNLAKSFQDKFIAAIILIAVSPLMAVIALAVKLSSPGPVLYRQTRVTWRNQPFQMLKFRTMPVDAERASGPTWAKPGDNRATKLGAILRATSLDELPQFWNVLKGDMSIVGPRPERPELIEEFKHKIPQYMKKHRVKAGITGWAQINGYRGNTDLKKRIEYDLYYIRNSSLIFDIKIIVLTLFKGFIHRNAY